MAPEIKRRKGHEWWEAEGNVDKTLFRYRRLWIGIVVSSCLVSLIPLIIMVVVNYYQYQKAFEKEVQHPMRLLASNARWSMQFFLNERLSVLSFIIHDNTYEELGDQRRLTQIFRNLKENHRDFVDIGLIDTDGHQRFYVGPYGLKDKNYRQQDWFKETLLRGQSVSDVFMGFRKFPHFAIAVHGVDEAGRAYVLRATFDAAVLASMREPETARPSRDTFIINKQGILQTPSKIYGKILGRASIAVPPPAKETTIREWKERGRTRVMGYAYIESSPFIYVVLEQRDTLLRAWFTLRNKLLWFLGFSMVVIVLVVLAGSTYSVNRIREADDKRLSVLHKVEYTAKMASIGRLAAGVAHEINNPLAIINEKAGLLKDLLHYSEDFPQQQKFLKNVESILDSVERCAVITRRLLRFAKHMDIRREPINLKALLTEVLGFLEKESAYRKLEIQVDAQPDVPTVESDRGRLQQVFLNIINNAFGAVEDGGKINIYIAREGDNHASVTVRDNGVGIPPEHLDHIFEPFFTTKEKHGTGLGLSITYGIVEKLGGKITVDSQVGEWTKFTVVIPVRPDSVRGGEDGINASAAG
jgi:two-component system NtrC family sensor kinase